MTRHLSWRRERARSRSMEDMCPGSCRCSGSSCHSGPCQTPGRGPGLDTGDCCASTAACKRGACPGPEHDCRPTRRQPPQQQRRVERGWPRSHPVAPAVRSRHGRCCLGCQRCPPRAARRTSPCAGGVLLVPSEPEFSACPLKPALVRGPAQVLRVCMLAGVWLATCVNLVQSNCGAESGLT